MMQLKTFLPAISIHSLSGVRFYPLISQVTYVFFVLFIIFGNFFRIILLDGLENQMLFSEVGLYAFSLLNFFFLKHRIRQWLILGSFAILIILSHLYGNFLH